MRNSLLRSPGKLKNSRFLMESKDFYGTQKKRYCGTNPRHARLLTLVSGGLSLRKAA